MDITGIILVLLSRGSQRFINRQLIEDSYEWKVRPVGEASQSILITSIVIVDMGLAFYSKNFAIGVTILSLWYLRKLGLADYSYSYLTCQHLYLQK